MGRLGIIAASGTLPLELANRAKLQGENPFIICLEGQADQDYSPFENLSFAPGKLKAVTAALHDKSCDRLLLAGKFIRPSLSALKLDSAGAALLGRLALKGDDKALRLVSEHFAEAQIKILPNTDFLPNRTLPENYHFGRPLTSAEVSALNLGGSVLSQLGGLDVGQSVIIQQDRVLGIEAAEGTQALIARTAPLIDASADAAVFVKMAKTQQDKILDMPVIGIATLKSLAEAGIGVAGVAAGQTMLADPLEAIEAELSLHGLVLTTSFDSKDAPSGNAEQTSS